MPLKTDAKCDNQLLNVLEAFIPKDLTQPYETPSYSDLECPRETGNNMYVLLYSAIHSRHHIDLFEVKVRKPARNVIKFHELMMQCSPSSRYFRKIGSYFRSRVSEHFRSMWLNARGKQSHLRPNYLCYRNPRYQDAEYASKSQQLWPRTSIVAVSAILQWPYLRA